MCLLGLRSGSADCRWGGGGLHSVTMVIWMRTTSHRSFLLHHYLVDHLGRNRKYGLAKEVYHLW